MTSIPTTSQNLKVLGTGTWYGYLVRVLGTILLVAACLKLLDEFCLYRIEHSKLFLLSLLLDLTVGSLLLISYRNLVAVSAGAVVFTVYSLYRLFNWSKTCDCFGSLSYFVSDWIYLFTTLIGATVCIFWTLHLKKQKISWAFSRQEYLSWFALCLGTIIGTTSFQYLIRESAELQGVLRIRTFSESGFSGEFVLKNCGTSAVEVWGVKNLGCGGRFPLPPAVEISHQATYLVSDAKLPGFERSGFANGSFEAFISKGELLQPVRVAWIGVVP